MKIREVRIITIAVVILAAALFISLENPAGLSWSWILFGLGLLVILISVESNDKGILLPASVLVVNSLALIARDYGVVDYPIWRSWAIFFGSIGLGLMVIWIAGSIKSWIIFPSGVFLVVCGAGFAINSWWSYQRWLRNLADHWYILLALFLLSLVFIRRFNHRTDPHKT